MEVLSSDLASKSSTQTDAITTGRLETIQPDASTSTHPVRSSFPQSSFSGLGSLFVQGRSNEVHPTPLRGPPQAVGFNSNYNMPAAEHPILPVSTTTVVNRSHQQRSRVHRQESLLRPLTSPVVSQPTGMAMTSRATIWGHRDSHEDIAAQRGILSFCSLHFCP